MVTLVDQSGQSRTTRTTAFGYYRFEAEQNFSLIVSNLFFGAMPFARWSIMVIVLFYFDFSQIKGNFFPECVSKGL
jgi:hypothetical protein